MQILWILAFRMSVPGMDATIANALKLCVLIRKAHPFTNREHPCHVFIKRPTMESIWQPFHQFLVDLK